MLQHLQATAATEKHVGDMSRDRHLLIMTERAMVCYNQALERLRDPLNMDGLEGLRTELELEHRRMRAALQRRIKTLKTLIETYQTTNSKAAREAARNVLEEVRRRREGVRTVQEMLARISRLLILRRQAGATPDIKQGFI